MDRLAVPSSLLCCVVIAATAACSHPNPLFDPDGTIGQGTGSGGEVDLSSSGAVMTLDGSGDGGGTGQGSPPPPPPPTPPPEMDDGDESTGEELEPAATLYINFGGSIVTFGVDDSELDQSELAAMFDGQELEPYGVGPKRAAILEHLEELWEPFDVGITDVRPTSGDYAMVVVTPTNVVEGGALAFSSLDCDDMNPRSMGFMFGSIDDALTAEQTAIAIAHAAGRGFGLEVVASVGEIMNQTLDDLADFTDECVPIMGNPQCTHDPEICPIATQNSFAELSARFPLP